MHGAIRIVASGSPSNKVRSLTGGTMYRLEEHDATGEQVSCMTPSATCLIKATMNKSAFGRVTRGQKEKRALTVTEGAVLNQDDWTSCTVFMGSPQLPVKLVLYSRGIVASSPHSLCYV